MTTRMIGRRQGRGLGFIVGGLVLLATLGAGLPVQQVAAHRTAGGTLTVFAAASLKEAFTAIGRAFDAANGSTTRFDFGGSDTLATQIVNGAPADVFASANQAQMKVVQTKGLVADAPQVFARNRLVLIVPRDNPGHLYSLPDLGRPGLRLVMEGPNVPAGKYARAAFTVMASDAAFGPGFLTRVAANIVSEETDVKSVVSKIALGEGDAGIVYVTDVTPAVRPKVIQVAIPAPFNQIATYPIASIKGGQNATLAQSFISYVLSAAGQGVLHGRGFITSTPGGYATQIAISGLVAKAQTLQVGDLQRLPTTTVTATLQSEAKPLGTATYTGVLLNTVVQAAVPITNTGRKNDLLRLYVTVGATDGYQVTISMGEMLPRFGHQPVLLAYAKNGQPLPRSEGAIELIVPGDTLAGRDVKNVDSIVIGTPLGTP